jgi:hypothetical protein
LVGKATRSESKSRQISRDGGGGNGVESITEISPVKIEAKQAKQSLEQGSERKVLVKAVKGGSLGDDH